MTTKELAQASERVLGMKRMRLYDGSSIRVWGSDGAGNLKEIKIGGMRKGEMDVVGQGKGESSFRERQLEDAIDRHITGEEEW